MTEKVVQNIYNNLQNWEGENAVRPYPIHKKLNVDKFGYNDIYQWITSEYALSENANILDAGCGVGFGSIFMAEHYGCHVTGISLSDVEVKKASHFAQKSDLSNKIFFEQKSYDDLKLNSYDFIIAIESVKHTLDIEKTLHSLKNALKPNGTLVIIDDFLVQNNNKKLVAKYAKDWALKEILAVSMFEEFKQKKDLTPFVQTKSKAALNLGVTAFSVLKPFVKVAKIVRGGFYLEQLFQQKAMSYDVLEFKKKASV